ncbi:hypothetical protein BDR26DRAFT_917580 [Obelidium mucronatum]|nr:hypothetical protein BDR26DRAFT_917580 [Obelidium mucronatum]
MSLFFGANPFDELVEKATSENLPLGSEDMFLNLDIADKIKSKQTPAKYAAAAIKRRLVYKNPNVQLLAIKLVDTCAKNSGSHFLVEVAAKDFMDTLVGLGGSLQLTDLAVRKAALALIQNWGLSFKGKPELSYACEVYNTLKREGVPFPPVEKAEVSSIMIDTTTAPEWTESDVCMRCRTQFTTFTRKHHCRNCGQTFCHSCSSKTAPLPHLGITEPVRVCDGCHLKLVAKAAGAISAPAAAANTTFRYDSNVDSAARKEQEDIERAIAASLASSGAPPARKTASPAPKKVNFASDEEDEDLKAAIEASLRDLKIAENNKSGVNYPSTSSGGTGGSTFSGFGGYAEAPSQPTTVSASGTESVLTPAPNANELSRIEIDNLKLFADLVERMEADVQQRGIGVMSHSQISTLYSQLFALQPKLQWSMDDAVGKYRKSMEINEKVSDSLQMYDRMLQERLNMRGGYGMPPQQQYWGAPPPQQQAGYYIPPAQQTYQQSQGSPQPMYANQPPQQAWGGYVPEGYAPPQQEYAPPPQHDPSMYQQFPPPPQQQPDPYQQQQQQTYAPPQVDYAGQPPLQPQQQAPAQRQPSPQKQPQAFEALQGLQFAPPVDPAQVQAPPQAQPQTNYATTPAPPQQQQQQQHQTTQEPQYTYGTAVPPLGQQHLQPQLYQQPQPQQHHQHQVPPPQAPSPAQDAPLIEF